jgi:hypothetical protein
MTSEEEAKLMRQVMEDSVRTHDERQLQGLEEMMALSASGDVTFLELDAFVKEAMENVLPEAPTGWNPALVGQSWSWTETVPCTPEVDVDPWSPSPLCKGVVHAPPQPPQQTPPAWQGPPTHLWQPPPYVDLTDDDE